MQLQAIDQFRTLTKQMQQLIDDVPAVMNVISTGTENFDRVLQLIQSSAIGAVCILALLVPVLWFQIFQNWRTQIMAMRRGRFATTSV
jgi:hypothetical protein